MNEIVKGSLTDLSIKDNKPLAETFLNVDMLVLIDMSGSMVYDDTLSRKPRYEVARDELRKLQEGFPGKLAVIAFSTFPEFCPSGKPNFLNGSTDMVAALEFAKPIDNTGCKIVMISDGEPDSPDATLQVAKEFSTKIDTIFIGSDGDMYGGRSFLERLSAVTGGQFFKSDSPGLLEESTKRLLLTG